MKTAIMLILMEFFIPRESKILIIKITKTDTKSKYTPFERFIGPETALGIFKPNGLINELKYDDQPAATVATDNIYSRISAQPIIQPVNSP